MTFMTENLEYVLLGLIIAIVLLVILWVVTFAILIEQKKKYEFFMGSKRRPSHNLEMKLEDFYRVTKKVEENYNKLLDMVLDLEDNMRSNVQKVGLVRYNPFDEMGGNLCFALALLDQDDNGVVLNGIHSRTGSFTYAKPIQMGVSIYLLSDEELQAVEMAKKQAFKPAHEKVMKIKFKRKFKKYDKDETQAVPVPEVEVEERKIEKSLGDVTATEKEQIRMEEQVATRIAVGDAINEDYFDELYPDGELGELLTPDDLEDVATILDKEERLGLHHSAEELHEMARELAAVLRAEEYRRQEMEDEEQERLEKELSKTNLRRKVKMEKRVLVEVEEDEIQEEMEEDLDVVFVQDAPISIPKEETDEE